MLFPRRNAQEHTKKGPAAKRLKLSRFSADREDNHIALHADEAGNVKVMLLNKHGKLYIFPRSGKLHSTETQPWRGVAVPECLVRVNGWNDVLGRLHCA